MNWHEALYSLVHPTSYGIYVALQNINVLNYGVSLQTLLGATQII